MGIKKEIINKPCAIVCGGEIKDINWLTNELQKYNFILAADSGYDWCKKCGVTPNLVIGDFDSINDSIESSVKTLKFPIKKDETDFSLCLQFLIENGVKLVDVFGANGGRIDHTLGAILSIVEAYDEGINSTIKTETSSMFIVGESVTLQKAEGYVSIFAVGGDASCVTLEGFEYPLNNFNLKCSSPLGVSNKIVSNTAKITLKSGKLLVILQK